MCVCVTSVCVCVCDKCVCVCDKCVCVCDKCVCVTSVCVCVYSKYNHNSSTPSPFRACPSTAGAVAGHWPSRSAHTVQVACYSLVPKIVHLLPRGPLPPRGSLPHESIVVMVMPSAVIGGSGIVELRGERGAYNICSVHIYTNTVVMCMSCF